MRATPLPAVTYLAAVLVSTLIVFLLQMALTLVLGLTLYGAHVPKNWPGFLLALLLGAAAFAGLGFGAASLIRSSEGASAVVNLIVLPMAFLSGSFGPTRDYPDVLQALADVLPLTYLIEIFQNVYLRDQSFFHDLTAILVVAVWGLIGLVIAWRKWGWMPRER